MTVTINQPAGSSFDNLSFGDGAVLNGKAIVKLSGFQELGKAHLNATDSSLTAPGALDGAIVQVATSTALIITL